MAFSITVLLDNQAAEGLEAEHGFALWIETLAGRVIGLGCCHAGVINTLDFIRKKSNNENTLLTRRKRA
jgi:metal-dependent hydrolase (beta-lactamase superfamily II)